MHVVDDGGCRDLVSAMFHTFGPDLECVCGATWGVHQETWIECPIGAECDRRRLHSKQIIADYARTLACAPLRREA